MGKPPIKMFNAVRYPGPEHPTNNPNIVAGFHSHPIAGGDLPSGDDLRMVALVTHYPEFVFHDSGSYVIMPGQNDAQGFREANTLRRVPVSLYRLTRIFGGVSGTLIPQEPFTLYPGQPDVIVFTND